MKIMTDSYACGVDCTKKDFLDEIFGRCGGHLWIKGENDEAVDAPMTENGGL